jgi:predicted metal-dependent hydrolase
VLIDVGGRAVPLVCVRMATARRATLRADATRGEIRLTLPRRMGIERAAEMLAAHGRWLAARVASWPAPLPFEPGAVIPVEGRAVTIDWDPAARRAPRLEADRLTLGGPRETVSGRTAAFLKALARSTLSRDTQALAARIGRAPPPVCVRDQRSRWGSCSAQGSINYSWRLVLAPEFVRRHVVAHEVAHLVHMNHGPEFRRLSATLAGEAPTRATRWLAANGAALHWIGRNA